MPNMNIERDWIENWRKSLVRLLGPYARVIPEQQIIALKNKVQEWIQDATMVHVRCKECGWKGGGKSLLTAANPFSINDTITGCPQCSSINSTIQVCDVHNCWEDVCAGWPSEEGYRQTCSKHRLMRTALKQL